MIYAIVCAQNEMSYQDVAKECTQEKWVPLLVMRADDDLIIPLFEDVRIAKQFAKRNLPESWLSGVVNITEDDAAFIDAKGWNHVLYNYPRKVKDIVKFDIEILEYKPGKELEVRGLKC
jgi:hypothetical protein